MAEIGGEGLKALEGIGGNITVWDEGTLEEKLQDAKQDRVYKGKQFIYPLWKSLLHKWFGYEDSKVYIVTPFLDEKRMEDVCRIILYNKAKDKLVKFFARKECNKLENQTIDILKLKVKNKITLEDESPEIREALDKIFTKITDPGKTFHAKFMCCVRVDEAEVLVTSANFSKHHFDFDNLDTVHYMTTTKAFFEKNFVQLLTG